MTTSTPSQLPVSSALLRWFTEIGQTLIEPAGIVAAIDSHRVRLLNLLLIILIPLSTVAFVLTLVDTRRTASHATVPALVLILVSVFLLSVAYGLSRSKLYHFAPMLTVGVVIAAVLISAWLQAEPANINYLAVGILLSSIFLSWRGTLFWLITIVAGMSFLSVSVPVITPGMLMDRLYFTLTIGTIAILYTTSQERYRAMVEERSAQWSASEQALRQARDELELCVQQRTSELKDSKSQAHVSSIIHHAETGEDNVITFIRDHTESMHELGDLRESEERLQQIASVLRVAIWIRDANTRQLLYINPAFEEIFGIPRYTFYDNPDTAKNAIHPEDKENFKEGVVGFSIEHRIVRPDGSIRWVWGRNFPVRNEAGEIYRIASIVEDITERKLVEEELRIAYDKLQKQVEEIQSLHTILREQARRDPLTKLYNRRYLDDILERKLVWAKREGYPVSLIMIDIDNFKRVNDVYGHQCGDLVLQRLAFILKEHTRAGDFICRYGGDEFLILLPTSPAGPAYQRAEKILSAFHAETIVSAEEQIKTTLSIGIAVYPIHGNTNQELLTTADDAMYEAKKRGKNCVVLGKL